MKTTVLATFVIGALAGVSAYAQGLSQTLAATVPFDFHVGSKVMPAGKYTLVKGPATGTITIQRSDHSAAVVSTTSASTRSSRQDLPGVLQFKRHGEDYFLASIFGPEETRGQAVPQSKAAREKLSASTVPPTTVEIVLLAQR